MRDVMRRRRAGTADRKLSATNSGDVSHVGREFEGAVPYTPLQTSVESAVLEKMPVSPRAVPDSPDGKSRYEMLVRNSADTFRSNLEFIERPRQVMFAVLLVSIVVYVSYRSSLNTFNATDSARAAVAMVFLTVMIYSVLQTRDGLMVRPHPAVWRAIHGIVLVYMIILVSLLVVPPRLGIQAVHMLFPELHGGPQAVLTNIIDVEPASVTTVSFPSITSSVV